MTSRETPTSSPSHRISKLKGKDEIEKVNQAKRKKDTQIIENAPQKILKLREWNQTSTDVIVTLFAGKKLSASDINAEFTDTGVNLRIFDGHKWSCQFCEEIDRTSSRVQLQKLTILLRVKKKQPGKQWSSLEFQESIAKTPVEQASPLHTSSATVHSPRKGLQRQKLENRASSSSPSRSKSQSLASPSLQSKVKKDPIHSSVNLIKQTNDAVDKSSLKMPTSDQSETLRVVHGDTDTGMPIKGKGLQDVTNKVRVKSEETGEVEDQVKQRGDSLEEKEQKNSSDEAVYELNHVKNDFYEPQTNNIVVFIYVKQITKDSVNIRFGKKDFGIKFQTSDPKFLSMHEGSTENTVFSWKVNVVDELEVEQCKCKVKGQTIELNLQKVKAVKWGALEASQSKAALTPSSSNWVSTATKKPQEATSPRHASQSELKPGANETGGTESRVLASKEKTADWLQKQEPLQKEAGASSKMNILTDNAKESSQKPTCMVSPLSKDTYNRGLLTTPGFTGLDNLGNTCFMNGSLQVLANTRELRDYFLEGSFQREINPDNVLGTGGKLATMFGVLMKVLWAGTHRSYAPAKLKNMVAMKWNQFMGYAQHDAQEFMAFLLDGLHEDLNRVKEKPYTEQVDSDGRLDEVVANEAWAVHKKRNDSFIVDLFQGQYKSKLVCPVCNKVSITFDPFMILPVPLPKKQRLLPITFFARDSRRKPVKYLLQLPKDAMVEQLKDQMYQKTKVHPRDLHVFEAHKSGVHSFFGKGTSLANVQATDKIYVFEILSEKIAGEPVIEICVIQRTLIPTSVPTRCSCCRRDCASDVKLKRCTKCYKTAYCDRQCQTQDWPRHKPNCKFVPELVGQPFMISLPESKATFSQLCHILEMRARHSVDVFQPPVDPSQGSYSPDSLGDASPSSPSLSVDSTVNPITADLPEYPQSTVLKPRITTATSTITSPSDCDEGIVADEGIAYSDSDLSLAPGAKHCDSLDLSSQSTASSSQALSLPDSGIETVSSADKAGGGDSTGSSPAPLTGYVVGRQLDVPDKVAMPFSLRPCDKDGKNLPRGESLKLEDKGEEPLDLTNIHYLAMDWKNSEKLIPYVIVTTKPLDTDENESVRNLATEEKGDITLDQCLSLFTEPEVLSPEHTWYCPQCKAHREATKQLSIWRLPHTLIIQLKRFSFRNFLWRDKIDKKVDFPVRGLDLTKYFMGNLPSSEPHPIYDLYGVVNHHGGILGGHYTSYARCPDRMDWKRNEVDWRVFDDSMVSSTVESQVITRSAYVLFYRRRNIAVSLPNKLPAAGSNQKEEVETIDDDNQDLLDDLDYDANGEPNTCLTELDGQGESQDDDDIDLGGLGPPEIDDNRFAEGDSDEEEDKHRLNLGMDLKSQLDDFLHSDSRHFDAGDDESDIQFRDDEFNSKYCVPAPSPSFTDMDAVD